MSKRMRRRYPHRSRNNILNIYHFTSHRLSRKPVGCQRERQERRGDVRDTEIVQTEEQMRGVRSVVCGECYSSLEKMRVALLIGVVVGVSVTVCSIFKPDKLKNTLTGA